MIFFRESVRVRDKTRVGHHGYLILPDALIRIGPYQECIL